MDTPFDYFLLIAEEQNISRAARRAFTSQQSMSKYLQQLEDKLGTPLFYRKPMFRLTPAGEVVLQRARQMKALEQNMEQEIMEISQNNTGVIRFGTSMGRGLQLLPVIYPTFRERYPRVQLETTFEMTPELCKKTLNGNLDLFIGVSLIPTPSLKTIPIAKEGIYVAVSDNLLMRHFPDDFLEKKVLFSKGVNIGELTELPFASNPQISSMSQAINQICQEQNIHLHFVDSMNSNGLQVVLAAHDCFACFFPAFLMPLVSLLNFSNTKFKQLNIFPVKELQEVNEISLSYRASAHLPEYLTFMIHQIKQAYAQYPMDSFIGIDANILSANSVF